MKLWLDDLRPPPDISWVWATTADEAIGMLEVFRFTSASLDHDLADERMPEKTGYDVALWMAEHNVWPLEHVEVHSFNPVGARRICGVVDRYGPYDKPCRWTPAAGG